MTYQQIRKYEAGENRVAAGTLVAIAEALGCKAADIIGEVERARRPAGDETSAPDDAIALARQIVALPAVSRRHVAAIVEALSGAGVAIAERAS